MSTMQELTHEVRVLLPGGRRKAMWSVYHRDEGIVFKEVWPRYERGCELSKLQKRQEDKNYAAK